MKFITKPNIKQLSLSPNKEYEIISYFNITNSSENDGIIITYNPSSEKYLFKVMNDAGNIRYYSNTLFLSTRELNIKRILNIL